MRHLLTPYGACLIFLVLVFAVVPVHSADVTVGLLAGSNKLGEVEAAAYAWAAENFKTTTLLVDKSGKFKNTGGTAFQPEDFAVLWLFYTETDTLPEPILADATTKAIHDYVAAGGGLFLSALALRYVVELDVEDGGAPRVFTPLGKEPPEIGGRLLTARTIPFLKDLIPVSRSFLRVWRKKGLLRISMTSVEIWRAQSSQRKHAGVELGLENVRSLNTSSKTGSSSHSDITMAFIPIQSRKKELTSRNSPRTS